MNSIKLSILLMFICATAFAQTQITNLNRSSLPKSIKYTGNLVNAIRYQDKLGDHIIITTETGETKNKNAEDDSKGAALYAYHYLIKNNSPVLTWKVTDHVDDCPLDIKANYIKDTFRLTDLDKNGKSEIWLMYTTGCRGDVSPNSLKIIMYEDNQKFAIRGATKIKVSDKDFEGGNYILDKAFTNGPAVFKEYATQLWKKNRMEQWD